MRLDNPAAASSLRSPDGSCTACAVRNKSCGFVIYNMIQALLAPCVFLASLFLAIIKTHVVFTQCRMFASTMFKVDGIVRLRGCTSAAVESQEKFVSRRKPNQ